MQKDLDKDRCSDAEPASERYWGKGRCSSTASGPSTAPSVDRPPFPEMSDFVAWLKTYEPDEITGIAANLYLCPIAQFLNCRFDTDRAYVRPDANAEASWWRVSDDGSGRASLPEWANDFANCIDRVGKPDVRASTCLSVISGLAPQPERLSPGSAPNTDFAQRQNDITTGTAPDNYYQQLFDSDKAWAERNGGQRERE